MTFALLFALTLGCDDAADLQKNANRAQTAANEKIADVRSDANQETRNLQAAADKKIAAAVADFQKLRESYRHATTEALIALDVKIANLDAAAKKANGSARTTKMVAIDAIKVRREAFLTNYASLDNATYTTWDATKVRLDAEWDALSQAVDAA